MNRAAVRHSVQGESMKKILVAVALIGLFGTALVGCRAGAEIDPDARGATVLPR